MTIQLARTIGNTLGVRSETRIRVLDSALRQYVRAVPQSPILPVSGTVDASQVTSGTFADARVAESNVTQHEGALQIDWTQLTSIPSTFPPSAHNHDAGDINAGTLGDARLSTNVVLRSADGNATTPNYNFTSETGTGWYREGAGLLSAAVGGTLRLRLGATYVAVQGVLRLNTVLSPAQITADQNDYSPTGIDTASSLRLDTDASRTLTGLQTPNLIGRVLPIVNVGANNLVLANESGSSTAAYRFAIGANITVTPGGGVVLLYDSTSGRWRCIGKHV